MNKHIALAILGLVLWFGIGMWLPLPWALLFTMPGGFLFGFSVAAYFLERS